MIENYVVIDLEMTGLNAKTDYILEVGAVRVRDGGVQETFGAMIRQPQKIKPEITDLTGITNEMMENGGDEDTVMQQFLAFMGDDTLVGQNVIFDYSFVKQWAVNHKISFERMAVDTLKLARKFLPENQKKDLESLCTYFKVERKTAHRALDDARQTQQIFEKLKILYGAAFEPKPLCYKAKKQSPATERQKKYLCEYAKYYQLEVPENLEYLTKSEASRLTDRWILQYGKLPKTN